MKASKESLTPSIACHLRLTSLITMLGTEDRPSQQALAFEGSHSSIGKAGVSFSLLEPEEAYKSSEEASEGYTGSGVGEGDIRAVPKQGQ